MPARFARGAKIYLGVPPLPESGRCNLAGQLEGLVCIRSIIAINNYDPDGALGQLFFLKN